MTLPDFVICGAQKSGTSSLSYLLSQHPKICETVCKEMHFFCWDETYKQGEEWYEKKFKDCESDNKIGEKTPYYMYHLKVPGRMKEVIPEAQLMFILRNPVDRAYSHYWHEVRKGRERLSFEEAIKKEEKRIKKDSYKKNHFSYLDRGKYAEQIKGFLKYYDRKKIKTVIFEDFKETPIQTVKELYRFLGVDPDFIPEENEKKDAGKRPRSLFLSRIAHSGNPFLGELPQVRLNETNKGLQVMGGALRALINKVNWKTGYPNMEEDTRKKLNQYFEPYNKKLEKLLDIDVDHWKN